LYIVAKGSSGKWSVLFPSASISQGRNRVRPSDRYQVPASSDGYFMFSGPSGTEKLYILLSRQPSNELDSLIYLTTDGNDADASRGVTERFDGGTFESTYKRLTSKDILTGVQEKAIYAVGGLKLVDGPVALELDLKHR